MKLIEAEGAAASVTGKTYTGLLGKFAFRVQWCSQVGGGQEGAIDLGQTAFILQLIAELDKLERNVERGDIVAQEVPVSVCEEALRLSQCL